MNNNSGGRVDVLFFRKSANCDSLVRGASMAPNRSRASMKDTIEETAGSLPASPIFATSFSRGGTLVYVMGRWLCLSKIGVLMSRCGCGGNAALTSMLTLFRS